jgi:hypothetical protein
MFTNKDAAGMEFRKNFAAHILAVEQDIAKWKGEYPATAGEGPTGPIAEIEGYLAPLRMALLTYGEAAHPKSNPDLVLIELDHKVLEPTAYALGIPPRLVAGVNVGERIAVDADTAAKLCGARSSIAVAARSGDGGSAFRYESGESGSAKLAHRV